MIAVNFENSDKLKIKEKIKYYYNYVDCNSFDNLTCPCCKKKGYLQYHKRYERNLIYYEDNHLIEAKIEICVVICKNCKNNGERQKYHALLPCFIFPYHIYNGDVIIEVIGKYMKNNSVKEIVEKFNIVAKLLYDWLEKFNIYLLASSIVLEINKDKEAIIEKIKQVKAKFLKDFYNYYFHPYFLFKRTCVKLCISS